MGNTMSVPAGSAWDKDFGAQMKELEGVEIKHQGQTLQAYYPPASRRLGEFTQLHYFDPQKGDFEPTTLRFLDLTQDTADRLNRDSKPGAHQFPAGLSFYREVGMGNYDPIPAGASLKAFA
ncbi:hypothetical protein EGT07_03090 [Herbaspirillum sp. HC18]|nr:hypothetical protein EGT07_03090 [Herbaspirillum sp. HC18]